MKRTFLANLDVKANNIYEKGRIRKILVELLNHEIVTAASRYRVSVQFIASISHYGTDADANNWIFLDPVDQAVDWYIINRVKKEDLVITQDLALATLLVAKQAAVITPRGQVIEEADADEILLRKHMRLKNQKQGNKIKGPAKLTKADKQKFEQVFEFYCRNMQE